MSARAARAPRAGARGRSRAPTSPPPPSTAGKCEWSALTAFYGGLMNAPCISIPGLDAWKCASLAPPTSLSVGATWAVIVIIILGVTGLFMWHMKRYSGSFAHIKFAGGAAERLE